MLYVLKSATFWAAVGAVAAVLSFIVLWLYTIYTRRMMETQTAIRRAEIAPMLVPTEFSFSRDPMLQHDDTGPPFTGRLHLRFKLANSGKGIALQVRGWRQQVPTDYKLKRPVERLEYSADSHFEPQYTSRELLPGASTTVSFTGLSVDDSAVYVLSCIDISGREHQLQVLTTNGFNGNPDWSITIVD